MEKMCNYFQDCCNNFVTNQIHLFIRLLNSSYYSDLNISLSENICPRVHFFGIKVDFKKELS
jgi:hypothetical protein